MHHWKAIGLTLLCLAAIACRSSKAQKPRRDESTGNSEATLAMKRLLTPPAIAAEPGFTATVLVGPGLMYDPLDLVAYRDGAVVADDGREEGDQHGGRIYVVDKMGIVSVITDTNRLLPPTGLDVAPDNFQPYAGHIFTLSQPRSTWHGSWMNHVILHVDPGRREAAEIFCTLPNHGTVGDGIPGAGFQARFGPKGSQFGGRLFAVTVSNATIYQVTPDRQCKPFLTLDGRPWSKPIGFAFSLDGTKMYVAAERAASQPAPSQGAPVGVILAANADGKIDPAPIAEGLERPYGVAVAPAALGTYAGQIFFTASGRSEHVEASKGTRTVYRVTPAGKAAPVATGFFRPVGIAFVDRSIWVADIKGDFMNPPPGVQVPDGAIIKIDVTSRRQ